MLQLLPFLVRLAGGRLGIGKLCLQRGNGFERDLRSEEDKARMGELTRLATHSHIPLCPTQLTALSPSSFSRPIAVNNSLCCTISVSVLLLLIVEACAAAWHTDCRLETAPVVKRDGVYSYGAVDDGLLSVCSTGLTQRHLVPAADTFTHRHRHMTSTHWSTGWSSRAWLPSLLPPRALSGEPVLGSRHPLLLLRPASLSLADLSGALPA